MILARLDVEKGRWQEYELEAGMFFVATGPIQVDAREGRGLMISRIGYEGLFQIGGPIEERGRLKYVNGCSDTMIVAPPKKGDPCLNHLHIPPHVDQTYHDHPSNRIGVIAAGSGWCLTPDPRHPSPVPDPHEPDAEKRIIHLDGHEGWDIHELKPGCGWWIPTGLIHSFHTEESHLDVIAWHPETVFGPTDEDHPMVSRTLIEGRPVSEFEGVLTKEIVN